MHTAPDAYTKLAISISLQACDLASIADAVNERDPTCINWGHVADLRRIERMLHEAHHLMVTCAKA